MDLEAINMEVAYNPERRIAITEDMTVYTLEEIFFVYYFTLFYFVYSCYILQRKEAGKWHTQK